MDKKSQANSSSWESRFHIGKYDSAAWMAANRGSGGGGRDMHEGRCRFDDCGSYPYTRIINARADRAQSSGQKK